MTKTKTKQQNVGRKTVKNPTTNFYPDSHKQFCKRCKTFNGGCPASNPSGCDL